MIVQLTYFRAEFETECVTFRPSSTVLDHALVLAGICVKPQATTKAWSIPVETDPVETLHIPFQTPLQRKLNLLSTYFLLAVFS